MRSVKPEFCDIVDPLLAWATFTDENTVKMIVPYTNQSINESTHHSKQNKKSNKFCHVIKNNE